MRILENIKRFWNLDVVDISCIVPYYQDNCLYNKEYKIDIRSWFYEKLKESKFTTLIDKMVLYDNHYNCSFKLPLYDSEDIEYINKVIDNSICKILNLTDKNRKRIESIPVENYDVNISNKSIKELKDQFFHNYIDIIEYSNIDNLVSNINESFWIGFKPIIIKKFKNTNILIYKIDYES